MARSQPGPPRERVPFGAQAPFCGAARVSEALKQGRGRFIDSWGEMGPKWGVPKTMAQIHALLMVSEEALSTDDIMEQLGISRGNANMNLRSLSDWGLVRRVFVKGDRK